MLFFYWLYESHCCVSKSSKAAPGEESDTERTPLIHSQTPEQYNSDTVPRRSHTRRRRSSSSYYGYVARSQPNRHIITRLNQEHSQSTCIPDSERIMSGSGGYTSM